MMVSQRFSNSYDNSCSNIIVRPNKYIQLNCNPPLKNIFIPNKAEMNAMNAEVTGSNLIKVYDTNKFMCLQCSRGENVGMSLTQLKSHVNNKHDDCCFPKVKENVAKYTNETIEKETNNNDRSKTEIIQYSKISVKFMCGHCNHNNKKKGLSVQALKLHFEGFCKVKLGPEVTKKSRTDLNELYKIKKEKATKESKNKKKKLKDHSGEIETSLSVTSSNLNTNDEKVVMISQDSLQNLFNESKELENVRNHEKQLVATQEKHSNELKNVEKQLVTTQEKLKYSEERLKYYKKICFQRICSSCHERSGKQKCKVCECYICAHCINILGMGSSKLLICVNCSVNNNVNAKEWFEKLMCNKNKQKKRKSQNEQPIKVGDEIYRYIPFDKDIEEEGLFLIKIIKIIGLKEDPVYERKRMKFEVKYDYNNICYDEFISDDVDYYFYNQSVRVASTDSLA